MQNNVEKSILPKEIKSDCKKIEKYRCFYE